MGGTDQSLPVERLADERELHGEFDPKQAAAGGIQGEGLEKARCGGVEAEGACRARGAAPRPAPGAPLLYEQVPGGRPKRGRVARRCPEGYNGWQGP